jgi:predicted aminopeptidase
MAVGHSTVSRALSPMALALALVLSSGCQTVAYYSQAVAGQWRVLTQREPVDRMLARLDATAQSDPQAALLQQRLRYSQSVLDFAETELALQVDRRYRTYVDLDRPAVLWNLFAAPPLSLEAHQWCYPIVGCAPYRGYFNVDMARRQAAALRESGFETYLSPVPAYSTLGWFADPLMSSFITWPEPDLAELLFHELAHGEVWVAGDVAFNESFATFVGRQGLALWLRARGERHVIDQRELAAVVHRRLLRWLVAAREALQRVYASDLPEHGKLARKAEIFDAVRGCYQSHRQQLGGGRYDDLIAGLNNARLLAVATYEDLVPGFAVLFDASGGHWPEFYRRVRELGGLDEAARRAALTASGEHQVAQGRDDDSAHEIQCDALAGHLSDGESAGGIHDDVGRGGHRQHESA